MTRHSSSMPGSRVLRSASCRIRLRQARASSPGWGSVPLSRRGWRPG
ncbi:hypothetical protein HMPREF3150_05162 [Pseudomonas aeruginosa]|nr:hypothetical protein HMPREF3150_05162 [Pseudomonas aeruginosa]